MAFVTDSNHPQPLWQPPLTACLTASGAASEAPSLLMHAWRGGLGGSRGGRVTPPPPTVYSRSSTSLGGPHRTAVAVLQCPPRPRAVPAFGLPIHLQGPAQSPRCSGLAPARSRRPCPSGALWGPVHPRDCLMPGTRLWGPDGAPSPPSPRSARCAAGGPYPEACGG